MKKIAVIAAVLALILAFGGCSSSDTVDNDQIARRFVLVKSYLDSNRLPSNRIIYVGQIQVNNGSYSEQLSYVVEEGSTQTTIKTKDVRIVDDNAIENTLYVFNVRIDSSTSLLIAADADTGSIYRKYIDVDGNEVYVRVSPALDEDYLDEQVALPSATPLPTVEPTGTDGAGGDVEETGDVPGAEETDDASGVEETPAAE